MIAQGQHLGVAGQIARGEVGIVCIFIGGNDFIEAMSAPNPTTVLDDVADRASYNLELALGTILAASPEVQVILATVPDIGELPEFVARGLPAPWLEAAKAAIQSYNERLRGFAARESRVTLADLYAITELSRLLMPRRIMLAGRSIERLGSGDDLQHAFLADGRHIGIAVQGLMARLILATANRKLGTDFSLLTDREILDFAESIPNRSAPTLAGGPTTGPAIPTERAATP